MKVLQTQKLVEMFEGGYRYLKANRSYVDSLNVFPVPDGDTGINMTLTMESAIKEMQAAGDDLQDVLTAFARGALKGARGNSGVILSQIIKGICKSLADADTINTKAFAKALQSAREIAYNAVTKPKEGTILTVIRYIAENSQQIASKNASFVSFFESVLAKGEEILQKTPDMLPVLKKAGVVDAGGRGLLCVFQGFYNILAGVEIPENETHEDTFATPAPALDAFGSDEHDLENIKFAYCTEYFIINIKKHVTEEDVEKLREKLMEIGDCVIAIGDISFIKVHVHTNQPNKALYYALQLGELDRVKIENMLEQNRAIQKQKEESKKPVGILAICTGDGMEKIFRDLSVDEVIEGGQTMNPSVEDILTAVEKVNSDNVIVLPNNGNIILAAEKVSELTKKKVYVIPTKEIPQGIRAALAFDPEFDAETNAQEMRDSFADVRCGQVTRAVRTTELDGFSIHEGDYIGLDGKKITAKADSPNETCKQVVSTLIDEDSEVITLYYGEDVTAEQAQALASELEDAYPDCDVVTYYGGQPHYYYMLSVE